MSIKSRIIKFSSEKDFVRYLYGLDIDPAGINIMKNKLSAYSIEVRNIRVPAAIILKQEFLAAGGETAIPKKFIVSDKDTTGKVLILANKKQILNVSLKLKKQQFGLNILAEQLKKIVSETDIKWSFTDYRYKFSPGDFKIMGIVNVTPDSFYDGGKYNSDIDNVLEHCKILIEQGADILDIGGQSTRPGSVQVDEEEELKRVIPVIEAVKKRFEKIPVSVDSTNYNVVRQALELGTDIINDISGLKFNAALADLAAEFRTGLVLMHIKGTPENMQDNPEYEDLINELIDNLDDSIETAVNRGVNAESVVVDPGIGFGKTIEHNYSILNQVSGFLCFQRPVLIGLSNKSFLGKSLNLEINERVLPSCVANAAAYMNGAHIFRTHNVKETLTALNTAKNILNF